MDEQRIAGQALEFMRLHQAELRRKYVNGESAARPFTIFMAGAPGAGKTESAKALEKAFHGEHPPIPVVRIDPDEIRDEFPKEIYNGSNAHMVQRAVIFGVEKVFDHAHNKSLNIILDGTFASGSVVLKNVKRAVEKGRKVGILFVYQDPIKSWELTQKREALEGRKIRKEDFIQAYFKSISNVQEVKDIYESKVSVFILMKNHDKIGDETFHFNVSKVDPYIKIKYDAESLKESLKDVI